MMDEADFEEELKEILLDAATGQTWPIGLERIKALLAPERAEAARLKAALEELDALDPDDFKTGQSHLSPAFREVNFKEVVRTVIRIVNRTLHNTDENGQPLPAEEVPDAPA